MFVVNTVGADSVKTATALNISFIFNNKFLTFRALKFIVFASEFPKKIGITFVLTFKI